MLFRALFWIAVAALLLPHEPDLGLGRPETLTRFVQPLLALIGAPGTACNTACPPEAALPGSLHGFALHSLAEVKADIEADERARGALN